MEARIEEGVTLTRLTNRLLIAFIIITTIFATLFYLGLRPGDLLYSLVPVSASRTKPPKFIFAFYGSGDNKLDKPMGIAAKNNLVFVTDAGTNKVEVFDRQGKYKFSFGKLGTDQGEFNFPYGIDVDDNNQVYVSDMKNHRIEVFDTKGNFIRIFPETEKLNSPGQLVIKYDKVYVTDIMQNKVYVFGLNGKKKLEFGKPGTEKGQFKYPNGITVDSKGKIYVADTGNNRVQVFDQNGTPIRMFSGGADNSTLFSSPRSMTIVHNDTLFVVNSLSSQIWVANLLGRPYYQFGQKGDQNEQFNFPKGICVDKDRLFITDGDNHGVKVYQL